MIDPINEILRDLIQSRVPLLAGQSQVGFEPPNDDWRQNVQTFKEDRINLYLYDIRENLKLRTTERTRIPENGWYREIKPPVRLDCHYLVTAWSHATFAPPLVEPTRVEHVLLSRVLHVLLVNRPLEPSRVYAPGVVIPSKHTLNNVPPALRGDSLPVDAAYPEGLRDQGDFWSTMKSPWRPSIELVVTVPALLKQDEVEVPMVTGVLGQYLPTEAGAAAAEVWATIGGTVVAGKAAAPVGGAWVQIVGLTPPEVTAVDLRTVSQPDGRFLFERLRPGHYHLRAIAMGVGDIGRDIDLPSETGEYDLQFP
jgi:hypothetical protein